MRELAEPIGSALAPLKSDDHASDPERSRNGNHDSERRPPGDPRHEPGPAFNDGAGDDPAFHFGVGHDAILTLVCWFPERDLTRVHWRDWGANRYSAREC